jgi:hypothetical protein
MNTKEANRAGTISTEQPAPKLPTPPTNAALEKMKKLAGTWLFADQDGKPTDQVASIIKITAGGSVVHETLFLASSTKWFPSTRSMGPI